MANQIRVNNVVYSSTEGADHEKMNNRRGAGITGEAWHLDGDMYAFVQANYSGVPATPLNVSPTAGETNVYQFIEFAGSAYSSPRDTPMLGMEIRIGLDPDVLTPVYEGYMETAQTAARFADFEAVIQPGEAYFWSVRYVDADGRKGNWSVPTGFTTAAEFQDTVVLRPQIAYPQEGARVSPVDPMLITTPFRIEGATDSHESTDWQIASRADFEPDHILAESLDDTENKTSVVFGGLDLSGGAGLYARARHGAAGAGKSQWSPIRHTLLKEFHDDFLIGVGVLPNGLCQWIDGEGNAVNVRGDYFESRHPLYQFSVVTVQGQRMRALQETHVRCDAGQGGFAYRYWVSPSPFPGSTRHPAFELSAAGPILYGEYLSGNDANSGRLTDLNSQAGKYVRGCPAGGVPSAAWLNTGGDDAHRGWGLMNVYERSLLTLLMLVEFKSLRFSSKIYAGVASGAVDAPRPNFHGITHAMFHAGPTSATASGEALNGVILSPPNFSGLHIATPSDPAFYVSLGKSATSSTPKAAGFNTAIHPDLGALQLLFIPIIGNGGLELETGAESGTSYLSLAYAVRATGTGGQASFPFLYASPYTSSSDNFLARLVKRTA